MAEWPPDQRERARIETDLGANLLVEAGAGSGKTTAMVRRMLALVRTGTAEIERIAAVTFTRKAAAELRERFQERLEDAYREAAHDPAADPAERERLGRALADLDRCFIGTIHAFCARLLRERPLGAGIPPDFREVTGPDEDRLRAHAWSRFLERLASRPRGSRLLAALHESGLRSAQLKKLFRIVSDNPDVRFPARRIPRPPTHEVARLRRRTRELLDASLELLPADEPKGGWDGLQKALRDLRRSRFYPGWDDDADFLDAFTNALASVPEVTFVRWGARELKPRIERIAARWAELVLDPAVQSLVKQWRAFRYPLALRFARAAAAFYASERRLSGTLNFQDLLVLTAKLLREDLAARRELGERYRYLLVDEFQDTDPLQAEVLFLLASGDAGSDWRGVDARPGALFVVGDPKQSIYRFRRADIAVYNQVRSRFRAWESESPEGAGVVRLVANFRSKPPLERLVERVFRGPLPPEETEHQASYAPLRVEPRAEPAGALHWYRFAAGRAEGPSLAEPDAELLASWIAARTGALAGDERPKPSDFLILTHTKKQLAVYARALEARGIPVQVSGAGVGMEEELTELVLLLRALADPGDPLLTVAVLEGLFFGLSHRELYAHVRLGGRWDLLRPAPDESPAAAPLATLRRWWGWTRKYPADVAVPRIVDELGVLPYAVAGELGSTRAGALLYALDALRMAALSGATTLAAAIEVLDAALEQEVDTPLIPGETNAVRLMNLHKAKGLEAKIVVLAYPAKRREFEPDFHVSRDGDGGAIGWLTVTETTSGKTKILAAPLDWEDHAATELRFREAERVRLMYVAATRAADELVVARCAQTESSSVWRCFHAALDELGAHAQLSVPLLPPVPREPLADDAAALAARSEQARAARERARRASYEEVTVSQLAKSVATQPAATPLGQTELFAAPAAIDTGAPRGAEWGAALHRALEAAAGGLDGDALRLACRGYLLEAERPADLAGEPLELDELLAWVAAVRSSRLWQRAQRAQDLRVEFPFSLRRETAEGAQLVDGVIDLLFREPEGWVIADYKSDVFASARDRQLRTAQYRRQVDLYADCWSSITGEPIKERVLVFAALQQEERW